MNKSKIDYTEISRETSFTCPIFRVDTLKSQAPDGRIEPFMSIECDNSALVIPVLSRNDDDAEVLMVTQWRHGASCESLEFPGGMIDSGEDPMDGAARECREETGYTAGTITFLGSLSQNPAIFGNRFFVYLAEDLHKTCKQELDPDEFLDVSTVKLSDIIAHIGEPPLINAHMAAALALLQKYLLQKKRN